jgi:ankyrin repeat protein
MNVYRVAVMWQGQAKSLGTGWQCAPDVIVTAFHVVAEGQKWHHEDLQDVTYQLLTDGQPIDLIALDRDVTADIAVLQCMRPLPGKPLPVVFDVQPMDPWNSWGFPKNPDPLSNQEPFGMIGHVALMKTQGGPKDLQLTVKEEPLETWEGASGAPVWVNQKVVGILTKAVGERNTVYAARTWALYKLLEDKGYGVHFSKPARDRFDPYAKSASKEQIQTDLLEHATAVPEIGRPGGSKPLLPIAPPVVTALDVSTVVKTTRDDDARLDRYEPPPTAELAVFAFLSDSPKLSEWVGAWLMLWAARREQRPIVRRLLELRCQPDGRIDQSPPPFDLAEREIPFFWPGGTPLHFAAARGDLATVIRLVEEGATIDARDRLQSTALHRAAQLREDPLRRILISANVAGREPGEARPETDDERALKVVKYLLSKDADPAVVNDLNETPAALAADFREMLEAVLARTTVGVDQAAFNAVSSNRKESLEVLARHNVSFDIVNEYGETLLTSAVRRFSYFKSDEYRDRVNTCVRTLLDCSANPRMPNRTGYTPLHIAADEDATTIGEMLIAGGADVNARHTARGEAPIFLAQSVEFVDLLLRAGASAAVADQFGFNALDRAVLFDRQPVIARLQALGVEASERTPVLRAIRTRDHSWMTGGAPVDCNWTDIYGDPLIFWALRWFNAEAVRYLVGEMHVSPKTRDADGFSAVARVLWSHHNSVEQREAQREIALFFRDLGVDVRDDGRGEHCCFSGFWWWYDPEVSAWLLAAADPDVKNAAGETLLMRAASWGRPNHVQELVRDVSDVNMVDSEGRNVIFYVEKTAGGVPKEALDRARLLLEAGADLDKPDNKGITPLMEAARAGSDLFVEWLLENGANPRARDHAGCNAFDYAIRYTRLAPMINRLRAGAAARPSV